MSESTGKRQSKMNKDTYKMNVTKAWYAQTEYIWYANKYNKYKTDNWQRTLMKTRN